MKEKTAVPVIVFFVIFFIAMSIYWHVANTKSYETGYSNGKEAGLNAAKSERLYWENRLYEAEQENYILLRYIMDFEAKQQSSMGDKVFAANGGLLPIDGIAINDSESGFLNKTGFSSPRDFFESFGIKIAEESDIPGWYNCYLPNGWTITLVNQDNGQKKVLYKDSNGFAVFYLITSNSPEDTKAKVVSYHRIPSNPPANENCCHCCP